MNKILAIAPAQWIPNIGTLAHKTLHILWDGQHHSTEELTQLLGRDPRSSIQKLVSKKYGNWLVHNDGKTSGNYRLDARHLIGSKDLDVDARLIAKARYYDRSFRQSVSESRRLGKATINHIQASNELSRRFEPLTLDKTSTENRFVQFSLLDTVQIVKPAEAVNHV